MTEGNFYPRPPRGGRPRARLRCLSNTDISIHVLREEDDLIFPPILSFRVHFYPRPPRGGRHIPRRCYNQSNLFLSTSSARRTTPRRARCGASTTFLSTSSARRTTSLAAADSYPDRYFYPRPPRGGRRSKKWRHHNDQNFYPRPPRGGRHDGPHRLAFERNNFYPRPPRGGRQEDSQFILLYKLFLSTSSARRTTRDRIGLTCCGNISIHVLREEDDSDPRLCPDCPAVFLSTSSARRTTHTFSRTPRTRIFLSTSSARRTTWSRSTRGGGQAISIHVLREEDDKYGDKEE